MKKFLLAYNPVSGDAMFKKKLDDIINQFQSRDCIIIPYRTKKEKSDPYFAACIHELKADGVIAAGGDGTLHKIINMMLKENLDIPVGIIPSGTSNDFASYLVIEDNFEQYLENICTGKSKYVDVGSIGDEYFINVASAGMMTSVAHEVNTRLKNTFGKLAYYVRGIGELPKLRALDFTIEADGETFHEKIFFILVINSPVVASFKNIADAKIDDGKLDMIILRQCNFPELMKIATDIIAGKNVLDNKNIIHKQATYFKFSCPDNIESDLDGEIGPGLPITVETVSHKLKMFIL